MTDAPRCPSCTSTRSKPVSFTWWGGIVGPKLLSHVKCEDCGTKYNGKSGKSNTTGIIIYTVVTLVIALVFLAVVVSL